MTPSTIAILAQFAIQFGLPAALKLIDLYRKRDATIEDVHAAFSAAYKSYEEYEDLPPGSPVTPLPPPTPPTPPA